MNYLPITLGVICLVSSIYLQDEKGLSYLMKEAEIVVVAEVVEAHPSSGIWSGPVASVQHVEYRGQRKESPSLAQPHPRINQRKSLAIRMSDHRVEINLRDPRRGFGQRAKREQQPFKRRDVGRRRAATTLQQPRHAGLFDHLCYVAVGQRQNAE